MFHEEVHVYISYSKEQQILECKVNGLIVVLVKYDGFLLLLYTILLLLHYSLQTLPKGLHLFSNSNAPCRLWYVSVSFRSLRVHRLPLSLS